MLYRILRRAAESHAEKVAVTCGDRTIRYARLKERVDRLACGLNSLGVGRSDRVAVIHPNCHRFLELYFAAAKIGAVLVPVNCRLAPADFVSILNDSQSKLLVAHPEFLSSVLQNKESLPFLEKVISNGSGSRVGWNEDLMEYEQLMADADLAKEPESPGVNPSDAAQIYYTSGTTGRPKGVVLTHRNNEVHAEGTIAEFGLTSRDRWLHVSPMFHLADAWAVWAITRVAGMHVMIPRFEPHQVLRAIERHRVTLSNFIPTMLNVLVHVPDIRRYDLSSLRLVLSGGAPIAREVVRKVVEVFGCDYIQTYGLTETSPFLTMSILKNELRRLPFEERLKYMATTGRPFCKVELKVVKEDGSPVLSDEKDVGEIIVRGETVTPGYWRRPEETSARIVDNWLHTRDLAVVNPEGYITIVDRKDDVIITGGEKVYSIEVEDVLYSHPSILEAAVIGLPDPVWGEKVTAVVVLKEKENVGEEEIIRFCKQRLAHFKAPKKVIFTDHLPKTGSAKISKYRLRQMLRPE